MKSNSEFDIVAYTVAFTGYVSYRGTVCVNGKKLKSKNDYPFYASDYKAIKQNPHKIIEYEARGFRWFFCIKSNKNGMLKAIKLSHSCQNDIIAHNARGIDEVLRQSK